MRSNYCISLSVTILVIILTVGAPEDEKEKFYGIDESNLILKQRNPLESKKELWLNPSDGMLITSKTKLMIASKKNKEIVYARFSQAVRHVVEYSAELRKADARFIDPGFEEPVRLNNSYEELGKLPDNYPTVVYPEIMVIVEYNLYKKFDLSLWKIIPYLLSFWNSVDMRFRFLENPRYRLNIKQIVLESEPGIMSYIKNHTNSSDYISHNSIHEATSFWYSQKEAIPLDSYDLAVTMINHKICGYYDKTKEKCQHVVYGQSFLNGACDVLHKKQIINKLAIVYDNGAYQGITATAHEIGHLLGAYDDGYYLINLENHTHGPIHCSYNDAFMMTPIIQSSANIFSWSKCSREDMEKFIKNESSQCLRNKPEGSNYPIARFLPGKLMDADQQCQQDGAVGTCNANSTCTMLQCYYPEKGCVKSKVPIADGTLCDTNAINDICLYGQCVFEGHLY